MVLWLFILIRVFANPLSNVFQKKLTQQSADPLFIICVTHALLAIACGPLLWTLNWRELSRPFWINILISALLAVASNALLVSALRTADLSVLGPINAYKAVVSLIFGLFLLHEIPTAIGVLGVLLIVAGSYGVVDRSATQSRRQALVQFAQEKGVQLRMAALVLSACEALFLKKALLYSSPLTTFVFWCLLGFPIAATAALVLLKGRIAQQGALWRRHKALYAWLALTTGLMQLATLLTFGQMQVGYALALFQTSTLISVFLGYKYFQETHLFKRLGGSLVMVLGAILIVLFGKAS